MKTPQIYKSLFSLFALAIAGCATPRGTFELLAYDQDNQALPMKVKMIATDSGIYAARNAICISHPQAVVRMVDIKTRQELAAESPYQCK